MQSCVVVNTTILNSGNNFHWKYCFSLEKALQVKIYVDYGYLYVY